MIETLKAWLKVNQIDKTKQDKELYKQYVEWLERRKLKVQPIPYVKFKLFYHSIMEEAIIEIIDTDENINIEVNEEIIETFTMDQPSHEEFSEEQVFKQIEDYTKSICNPSSIDYSLIVSGDSGLGKTVQVKNALEECLGPESSERQFFVEEDLPEGVIYDTLSQEEEMETEPYSLEWKEGPTKIPPQQLYIFLYKENGKVLLFDDADSLIDEPKNFDILKKVLDNKRVRTVGYGSKPIILKKASANGNDVIIPNSFQFSGRIIVVTNKNFSKIDTALKSRSLVVEVDLSSKECLKRVERLLPELLIDDPRVTNVIKKEVLDYLLSISDLFNKIDLRTVEQSILEYFRSPSNWKQLVKKSIQLKNKK